MKNPLILLTLLLSMIIAQPQSGVPENMSFQGLLTDSEGVAYEDGEYELVFRLIREMNDGSEQTIWEENHLTNITNGVFSVVLGSVDPLPLNISPNVQLETQIGDEILSPRQPLTSVPFALKSSRSQQAYQSFLADTAQFAMQAQHSQHATHADSAMFTAQSQHAVHADTAQYLVNMPMIDSVMFAEQAHNSMYADTAQFVALAQSALNSSTSENATNSVYADTANFVDLSQYNGNMNIDGTVTATSFIGDGSGLTGISGGGDDEGIGVRYMEIIFNVPALTNDEGDEISVAMDLDSALGINKEWFQLEAIRVVELNENHPQANLNLFYDCQWSEFSADRHSNCRSQSVNIKSEGYGYVTQSNGPFFTYSSDGQHIINNAATNNDVTGCKILFKVFSDW